MTKDVWELLMDGLAGSNADLRRKVQAARDAARKALSGGEA